MKGSRLADVLDDKVLNTEFWNKMFAKMNTLLVAIETVKGPGMSIDDKEYRWVQDRIEYYESEDRLLSKEEMNTANDMWRQYGKA